MAFQHGKNAFFSFNNGSARDLSAFISENSLDRSVDEVETTTYGATGKTYLTGLTDNSFEIKGYFDPTAATGPDAVLSPELGGSTARACIYGPYGSTAGFVRYTFNALVTKYNIKGSVSGPVSYEATLRISGAVTRDTF